MPPGAESFDSAWCTYHWTFDYIGKTPLGEPIRRDEWGCTQIVPQDQSVAYSVVERPPLVTMADVEAHRWPAPSWPIGFFESRKRIIAQLLPGSVHLRPARPGPARGCLRALRLRGPAHGPPRPAGRGPGGDGTDHGVPTGAHPALQGHGRAHGQRHRRGCRQAGHDVLARHLPPALPAPVRAPLR